MFKQPLLVTAVPNLDWNHYIIGEGLWCDMHCKLFTPSHSSACYIQMRSWRYIETMLSLWRTMTTLNTWSSIYLYRRPTRMAVCSLFLLVLSNADHCWQRRRDTMWSIEWRDTWWLTTVLGRYEAWENGNPADEGRARTSSPTHPHNEQSLDGWKVWTRGVMVGQPQKNRKFQKQIKNKKQIKIKIQPGNGLKK